MNFTKLTRHGNIIVLNSCRVRPRYGLEPTHYSWQKSPSYVNSLDHIKIQAQFLFVDSSDVRWYMSVDLYDDSNIYDESADEWGNPQLIDPDLVTLPSHLYSYVKKYKFYYILPGFSTFLLKTPAGEPLIHPEVVSAGLGT